MPPRARPRFPTPESTVPAAVLLLRALPAAPASLRWLPRRFHLRHLGCGSSPASCLRDEAALAIVFSASGPVVSTGNFPNLSWSMAWIPWIAWAADRDRVAPSARGFVLLTAMIAFQMLSGEPVTMIGTVALLVAYLVVCGEQAASARAKVGAVARAVGAISAAAAVSAVQLVPMALAAGASPRGLMRTDNFWSIHPLWLVESVLPRVFGDTFSQYAQLPWVPRSTAAAIRFSIRSASALSHCC
jgi:hypothetical protein